MESCKSCSAFLLSHELPRHNRRYHFGLATKWTCADCSYTNPSFTSTLTHCLVHEHELVKRTGRKTFLLPNLLPSKAAKANKSDKKEAKRKERMNRPPNLLQALDGSSNPSFDSAKQMAFSEKSQFDDHSSTLPESENDVNLSKSFEESEKSQDDSQDCGNVANSEDHIIPLSTIQDVHLSSEMPHEMSVINLEESSITTRTLFDFQPTNETNRSFDEDVNDSDAIWASETSTGLEKSDPWGKDNSKNSEDQFWIIDEPDDLTGKMSSHLNGSFKTPLLSKLPFEEASNRSNFLHCYNCNKQISARGSRFTNAVNHIKSCCRIKTQACSSCGFKFSRKHVAREHIKLKCPDATAVLLSKLKTDKAIKDGFDACFPDYKKYFKTVKRNTDLLSCWKCSTKITIPKGQTRRKYAQTHVKICCSIKPFSCSSCGFKSAYKAGVQSHIKIVKCPDATVDMLDMAQNEKAIDDCMGVCFPAESFGLLDTSFMNTSNRAAINLDGHQGTKDERQNINKEDVPVTPTGNREDTDVRPQSSNENSHTPLNQSQVLSISEGIPEAMGWADESLLDADTNIDIREEYISPVSEHNDADGDIIAPSTEANDLAINDNSVIETEANVTLSESADDSVPSNDQTINDSSFIETGIRSPSRNENFATDTEENGTLSKSADDSVLSNEFHPSTEASETLESEFTPDTSNFAKWSREDALNSRKSSRRTTELSRIITPASETETTNHSINDSSAIEPENWRPLVNENSVLDSKEDGGLTESVDDSVLLNKFHQSTEASETFESDFSEDTSNFAKYSMEDALNSNKYDNRRKSSTRRTAFKSDSGKPKAINEPLYPYDKAKRGPIHQSPPTIPNQLHCMKCNAIKPTQLSRCKIAMRHVKSCCNIKPYACSACGLHSARIEHIQSHIKARCQNGFIVHVDKELNDKAIADGFKICFPNDLFVFHGNVRYSPLKESESIPQLKLPNERNRTNKHSTIKSESPLKNNAISLRCSKCQSELSGSKEGSLRRNNALNHAKSCCGIKPYACSSCGLPSARKQHIQTHIKTKCPGGEPILVDKERDDKAIVAGLKMCFPKESFDFHGLVEESSSTDW